MLKFVVAVIVPIVAAVIGAFGGAFYQDIRTFFVPDDLSGQWVLIGADEEPPGSFEEGLTLKSSGGTLSGAGQQGNYKHVYSGFAKETRMSLAYHTVGGPGIGVFMGSDPNGQKRVFTGSWKGLSCEIDKLVDCPAILVKGTPGSHEVIAMRKTYDGVLQKAHCSSVSTKCSKGTP